MHTQTFKKKLSSIAAAVVVMMGMTACNGQNGSSQNPSINGVDGPHMTVVNNMLTITTVLNNVVFEGGLVLQVPHTQKSYVEVSPSLNSKGMLLQIGIDLNDLSFLGQNSTILEPNTLPGGRPLPGITGGSLPSIAVQVPQWDNATIYIGSAIVGTFIPVKLGAQGVTGTFRFYDNSNKQVGTISIIGSDADGKNSGILLLLNTKSVMLSSSASTSLM